MKKSATWAPFTAERSLGARRRERCRIKSCCLKRRFTDAIAGQGLPVRLSLDHDPLFAFQRWQANLRILGIEAVPTVPQVPWSHPFVERLVGTIRRKYLGHLLFWNVADRERKLEQFRRYYNGLRVHQGRDDDTLEEKAGCAGPLRARLERYAWQSHCRGYLNCPSALKREFAMYRVNTAQLPTPDILNGGRSEGLASSERIGGELNGTCFGTAR